METANEKTIINKMNKPNINNINKNGDRYYKGIKCINDFEFITLISSLEQIEETFLKINEIEFSEENVELTKTLKQLDVKHKEITLYLNTAYGINDKNEFYKKLDIINEIKTYGGGLLSGILSSVKDIPTIASLSFETFAARKKLILNNQI